MGASTATTKNNESTVIIKTAKKTLKRQESGSMKIKSLAKTVIEKVDDSDIASCKDTVRKLIEESDVFEVDGKMVMLSKDKDGKDGKDSKEKKKSKKRKSLESMESNVSNVSTVTTQSTGDDDGSEDKKAAKAARKAAKRAKKNKERNSTGGTDDATGASESKIGEIQEWRKKNKIILKDSRVKPVDETCDPSIKERNKKLNEELTNNTSYYPFQSFSDGRMKDMVAKELIKECTVVNGFEKPSPIQAQCWPILLQTDSQGRHRDAVGIAETGSGKTLAFAIPALSIMSKSSSQPTTKRGRNPRMLVLAPTRELAMQSQTVLSQFGASLGLTSTVIYGGVPKHTQKDVLNKGVDCIVATPGRLKDLINERACNLNHVGHLVLDEADRMLDMGFEEDVRFIIAQCKDKEQRQTAMFSATWPAIIQNLALEFMVDPICIYVGFEALSNGENGEGGHDGSLGMVDDSLSANKRVSQTVEVVEDRAREARLRDLLQKYAKGKGGRGGQGKQDRMLVFALYKKEAARLEGTISRWGYHCASIHGDKSQDARNKALAEFKDGSCPILVATDVAARGLDIPDVEVVINYTFPLTIEDYVHRIGRTGRAGKTGISHTFFQPGDKGHAGELQAVMRQAGQHVPEELLKFGSTIKKKEHKLYGNFGPKTGPMKKAVKITFDSDGE